MCVYVFNSLLQRPRAQIIHRALTRMLFWHLFVKKNHHNKRSIKYSLFQFLKFPFFSNVSKSQWKIDAPVCLPHFSPWVISSQTPWFQLSPHEIRHPWWRPTDWIVNQRQFTRGHCNQLQSGFRFLNWIQTAMENILNFDKFDKLNFEIAIVVNWGWHLQFIQMTRELDRHIGPRLLT